MDLKELDIITIFPEKVKLLLLPICLVSVLFCSYVADGILSLNFYLKFLFSYASLSTIRILSCPLER